jgi:hypothetical protein
MRLTVRSARRWPLSCRSHFPPDRNALAPRPPFAIKDIQEGFLLSIFAIKDIQEGNTTTARQILNQAQERIPIEFAEQPELRDELGSGSAIGSCSSLAKAGEPALSGPPR